MENKNEIYIGQKSRPQTCPICLRTKENAIAEQLQAGKPCGHEHCGFRLEIEIIAAILRAPDLEQLKSVTSESIETNKKTYDLLVSLRQSVREMKEITRNEIGKNTSKINTTNPRSLDDSEDRTIEISDEKIQAILERIDRATRTMSKLIEMKGHTQFSDSPIQSPEDTDYNQVLTDLQKLKERNQKNREEWDEYMKSREEFNQKMDEAWVRVHEALKGMREVVEEMKKESDPNDNKTN